MTELEREIYRMYADIERYRGGFGDGIEHGTYNPFEMILSPFLTPFEKTGVSVALLVYLETAIDNSTYDAALKDQRPMIESVVDDGLLNEQPFVQAAAVAFLESEDGFQQQLVKVYENVVRKHLRA